MNNKYFVGQDATSFKAYAKNPPITQVILATDEGAEDALYAGTEGYSLTVYCPWATQQMANDLLAKAQGFEYQGFEAGMAALPGEAERGDAVTVNGIYGMIADRTIYFNPGMNSDISAPYEEEVNHEFHYVSPIKQGFDRKIGQVQASLTVDIDNIKLEVEDEINQLSSSITVQLDSITSQITGINGQVSSITQTVSGIQTQITGLNNQVSSIDQKVDNITLSVSNGTESSYITLTVGGVQVGGGTVQFTGNIVFASDLTDGYTEISGDNILTGEVSAEYILLGGEMRVYEDTSRNADLGGYIGYVTSYDYNGNRTYGMGMIEAVTSNQVVATSGGVRMTTSNGEVVVATNITLDTGHSVNVYAGNRFTSNVDLTVTSDRNKKDKIQYDIAEKYIPLFDQLKPASFIFKEKTNDHRHTGFIAQDVEDALKNCGIPVEDFAALSIDDELGYGLTYGEFTAILTAKIQDIDKRLKALEV